MDKLLHRVAYVAAYRKGADQMATHAIGGRWDEMGIPVDEAIRWANLGYLPEEAKPHIDAGFGPDQACDADDAMLTALGVEGYIKAKLGLPDDAKVTFPGQAE